MDTTKNRIVMNSVKVSAMGINCSSAIRTKKRYTVTRALI